ncbi:MAG: hypothetical protein R3248_00710 [Candidatus Promineifilaceae bacterium]|nr:hypothetical protein [Candidatus Promineifilaceae bacterium]
MQQTQDTTQKDKELSTFASVAGGILGVSYPVLAISTGARAVYQLFFKDGVADYLPPALTMVAALLYLVATVGFTRRRRWAWRVSVVALSVETVFTFVVGTLSLINYDLVGHNAWTYFGMDYAFFPLIQPLLGLVWLLHPSTLRAYKIR